MIRAIRNNGTLSLILLVVFTIILRFKLFIDVYTLDFAYNTAEPLSRLFYSAIINSSLNLNIILACASIALALFQAFWVNQILIKYKIFEKEGFLPAIIYVLFISMTPEFIQCSPPLLSITFLIPILDKLLETYNNEDCFKLIFDCGFLVGLASLFYFPALFFLVFVFIGLGLLRSFNLKEWLAVAVGLVSVYTLAFTIYYLSEQPMFRFENMGSLFSRRFIEEFKQIDISLTGLGGIIIFTLAAVIYTTKRLSGTLIQYRKFVSLLLIYAIVALVNHVFPSNHHSSHLLLFMLPLSISFNNVFAGITKSYIADLIFITLLLFVLILQYLPYFYMP